MITFIKFEKSINKRTFKRKRRHKMFKVSKLFLLIGIAVISLIFLNACATPGITEATKVKADTNPEKVAAMETLKNFCLFTSAEKLIPLFHSQATPTIGREAKKVTVAEYANYREKGKIKYAIRINSLTITGNNARIKASIFREARSIPLIFVLEKEGNQWKILKWRTDRA